MANHRVRRLGRGRSARAPGRIWLRSGHTVLMSSRDPAAAFANVEQAEFWSQLAPTWLEFEDQLEQVGGPPGELAMARLVLLPGQRVVDLGCGSGRTTLELAARAGPGGRALCGYIPARTPAPAPAPPPPSRTP